MATKIDFVRTPNGSQRILDGSLKITDAFCLPVFVGMPDIADNPDEPGYFALNSDLNLVYYNGTAWIVVSADALSSIAAETAARIAADALKVDKVTGKDLSDNNYTSAEKTKLSNLSEHYVGYYGSLAALNSAHPTGADGQYATVDAGLLNDAKTYIWDDNDNAWILGSGSGGVTSVNTQVGAVSLDTDDVGEGSVNKYYHSTLFAGDFASKTTDDLTEGTTNKYFTSASVLATLLAGISFSTATAVVSTDDVIIAFGKLQAQITALSTSKQNALGFTPEDSANKNVNNGYAGLDSTGKVASAQLPSYVDDVIEVANFAALPGTGETGKIYVTLDTNFEYRWSGSTYIRLVSSPGTTDALTEGTTNLYFTAARVLAVVLTGISFGTSSPGLATDTILVFLGKVQAQINTLFSSPTFTGTPLLTTTPTANDNSKKIADTEYVDRGIATQATKAIFGNAQSYI